MDLHTTLLTIIAFSAVIAVLSTVFYALLNPVKENQARLEKRMDSMEKRMGGLEANQARMEIKLDQLIAAKSA